MNQISEPTTKDRFLSVVSNGQTEFIAYKRILFCNIDREKKTAFFKFTSNASTFIKNVENMDEMIQSLKAAHVLEIGCKDPQKHMPRRKHQMLERELIKAGKMELLLENVPSDFRGGRAGVGTAVLP